MFNPRIAVSVSVALAIAFFIGSAHAYTLGLDDSISQDADVLYALDRDGREVKIAQAGSAGSRLGCHRRSRDAFGGTGWHRFVWSGQRMESSTSMVDIRC